MDGIPSDRISAALEELLGWPPIARSPQLARFLSYIVTASLRGEEAGIKAYSIAVDVFGRPSSFDPQTDPIVRVQARRLRALLDQFYESGNGRAGVRIALPVGRYVPEFTPFEPADGPAPPPPPAESPVAGSRPSSLRLPLIAAAVMVVAAVGAAALLLPGRQPPLASAIPAEPTVLVGAFSNLTGQPELDGLSGDLAAAVEERLAPFEDIVTRRADTGQPVGEPPADGAYLVSGVIHPSERGIEVTASLSGREQAALWQGTFAQALPVGGEGAAAAAIARSIVREVAPFRGPLHEAGRQWLDAQARPLPAVNRYVCLLTYRFARETAVSTQLADALACHERLLRDQPEVPVALSSQAWLQTRAALMQQTEDPSQLADELAGPLASAERALALAPTSSMIYEHLGAIKNWLERFEEAGSDYVEALNLNPLNTDARAGYAIALVRGLQWAQGADQARLAIEDTPYPSPWYYYPVALGELREGRLAEAMESGRRAIRFGNGEIGTVITIVAAAELGRTDVVEELLPRLMGIESLRHAGVMTWLARQIKDEEVLTGIANDLLQAGVPPGALTSAF